MTLESPFVQPPSDDSGSRKGDDGHPSGEVRRKKFGPDRTARQRRLRRHMIESQQGPEETPDSIESEPEAIIPQRGRPPLPDSEMRINVKPPRVDHSHVATRDEVPSSFEDDSDAPPQTGEESAGVHSFDTYRDHPAADGKDQEGSGGDDKSSQVNSEQESEGSEEERDDRDEEQPLEPADQQIEEDQIDDDRTGDDTFAAEHFENPDDSDEHVSEQSQGHKDQVEALASRVSGMVAAHLERNKVPAHISPRALYLDFATRMVNGTSVGLELSETATDSFTREIVDYAMGYSLLTQVRRLAAAGAAKVFVKGADRVVIHYRDGRRETRDPWIDDVNKLSEVLDMLCTSMRTVTLPTVGAVGVDMLLDDGIRVNAAQTMNSTFEVSFRIPDRSLTTLTDLVNNGTIEPAMRKFLSASMLANLNIIVAGGSGAGKTTLLLAMLGVLESNSRIVTIEDSPELDLSKLHQHLDVVELRTGAALDGSGSEPRELTGSQLLAAAYKMAPDRIIVAEARDALVREMLQAMVTSSTGSVATIHARSADLMVDRIVECAGGDRLQTMDLIRNSVDLLIHVGCDGKNRRRITQISQVEPTRESDGLVRTNPIYRNGGLNMRDSSFSHPSFVSPPTGSVATRLADAGWHG